jgi:hypothetical protein
VSCPLTHTQRLLALHIRTTSQSDSGPLLTRTDQFFPKHYPGQRPEILWIGCEWASAIHISYGIRDPAVYPLGTWLTVWPAGSDARVPETTIMGMEVGPNDLSALGYIAKLFSARRHLHPPQHRQVSPSTLITNREG